MRVVGYVRVSSHRSEDQEVSATEQERAIKTWCRQSEHRLIGLYRDEGVSGTSDLSTRDGLPEALNAIQRGEADGLVVRELDRLSRDVMVQEAILADLWKIRESVEMFSTKTDEARNCGRNDPDEPHRKFIRRQLGLVAEFVRDLTVARMRAGKRAKRKRGGYIGGQVPLGKQRKDRNLVKEPVEQETIDVILELHRKGHSLRQIIVMLDAEGRRPKRVGSRWHPSTVRRVIQRAEALGNPTKR